VAGCGSCSMKAIVPHFSQCIRTQRIFVGLCRVPCAIVVPLMTSHGLLAQQRQAAILRTVRRSGGARVADLVEEHGVSDMTIRRDLDVLAGQGLVVKVHGGVTALDLTTTSEPPFSAKDDLNQAEKNAIAEHAAALVRPDSAIGLTGGTTVHALAALLTEIPGLTVVTNSLPAADALFHGPRHDQTVILTGGVRTPSDALVGPAAVQSLASLNLDQIFMGVYGMSRERGFTTPNALEVEVNQAFLRNSSRLVVVADHTKWEMVGLCTIAPLARASHLISDSELPVDAQSTVAEEIELVTTVEASSPLSSREDA
jgi:DeoR/GlpR family transcriptional regulator of sugar metabolism